MFVSKAYEEKLWANLERKATQARAFEESREYILPTIIDKNVEIPGLLRTTDFISISDISPEEFSEKIMQKLQENGIILKAKQKFSYSDEVKADIDFSLSTENKVKRLIKNMKPYNWCTQNLAVNAVFDLNWERVSADDIFIIGRNIYQCACGDNVHKRIIQDLLRRELAQVPQNVAEHLLNGMFYEVYFDSKSEFRWRSLKRMRLSKLLSLQSVSKYEDSIHFILKALGTYRSNLAILPNSDPEKLEIHVPTKKKDPPTIISVQFKEKELIADASEDEEGCGEVWKLSFTEFSLTALKRTFSEVWHVLLSQLTLSTDKEYWDAAKFRLPEGKVIKHQSTV